MKKQYSLQILRFAAASMVIFHHSTILERNLCHQPNIFSVGDIGPIGAAGVDIFFIISGFVIATTGPLRNPRPTALEFFWRRWSRVAPLFLIMTIPTLLAFSVPGPMNVFGAGGPLNLGQTIATLFFWPDASGHITPPYLSNGWTICLEMIFYSFVSFLLLAGRIASNTLLFALFMVILIVERSVFGRLDAAIIANPIFLEFAAGCLLAVGWRSGLGDYIRPWMGMLLLLCGLLWFSGEIVFGTHGAGDWLATLSGLGGWNRVLVFGPPAVLTVAGALALEPWTSNYAARWLAGLGDASYSIYLAHGLVMLVAYNAWRRAAEAPPAVLVVLSGLFASLSVGCLVYWSLERPVQTWVRGLAQRVLPVKQH